MPARVREAAAGDGAAAPRIRTILADHAPQVGSDMGDSARPVIERALAALGVESRTGVAVTAIDAQGVVFENGERLETGTVVWTAGMRANPLTAQFSAQRDRFGRLPVDEYLRVIGSDHVFAAGDVATLPIDGIHHTVMSCQHARPMGRFAGHNVVCDLLGKPMLPLRVDWYVTCLDLGPGARWSIRRDGTGGWRPSGWRPRPSNRPSTASGSIRHAHAIGARSWTGLHLLPGPCPSVKSPSEAASSPPARSFLEINALRFALSAGGYCVARQWSGCGCLSRSLGRQSCNAHWHIAKGSGTRVSGRRTDTSAAAAPRRSIAAARAAAHD